MSASGDRVSFNPTFFEGTEKKVELVVDDRSPSMREFGDDFWNAVVESAGARVLSRIANSRCDAYLLSESSLFVLDHKMLMITCGQTRLPDSVFRLLERIPSDAIRMFVYERKNEVFPRSQPTSFFDDVQQLDARLPGKAFRFGDEDEHHLFLFHLDRPPAEDTPDLTAEVLMYGLDAAAQEPFRARDVSTDELRRQTGVDRVIPGFTIDDHRFDPDGYSLNAIREDEYMTLHVTLREGSSYASFETNCRDRDALGGALHHVVEMFRPQSFDLIQWERGVTLEHRQPGYRVKTRVSEDLSCGYRVRFVNHYRPQTDDRRAAVLGVRAGRS